MHPMDRAVLSSPPPGVAFGMGAVDPAATPPTGVLAQLQSAIPSIPKTLLLGGVTWVGAKLAEYLYAEYIVKGLKKRKKIEAASPMEDLGLEPPENPDENQEEDDEEDEDPEPDDTSEIPIEDEEDPEDPDEDADDE